MSEQAFELSKHLVSAEQAEEIRAFICDHGEWGLGVEMLVDVLLEDDIAVGSVQKQAISAAMREMGLDRGQSHLREQ